MQEQNEKCIAPGITHDMQFSIAAYGYQCFVCTFCGHTDDVIEDSQP